MRGGASRWAVRLLGLVLTLIGVVLAFGGVRPTALGGSPYYVLAGAGLMAAGLLLLRLQLAGAWLYLGVFAATVSWAVREIGLNGWALVPRIVAPATLLVLVIASLPVLVPVRPAPLLAAPVESSAPAADATGADWPAYGGTYGARRYSPLAQITIGNVARLERAWVAHAGDLPSSLGDNRYGAQTTPLKVGNTLYLCSAKKHGAFRTGLCPGGCAGAARCRH